MAVTPPADESDLFGTVRVCRLSEVTGLIEGAIGRTFPDTLWVVAEIAEIRSNQKGHCYMTLVERAQDGTVAAQVRANVWAYAYRMLSAKFIRAAGEELKQGMKVLFFAEVTFHAVHGLSLNVRDADPSYTLGEAARIKRETIERLGREGLIGLNKSRDLPLVPLRIAVVSSPTAAGYGDFTNHLKNNPYGYRFRHRLFAAAMQGLEAEGSMIAALGRIGERAGRYDLAVIIRGGGSQVDLSCFDSYALAAEVARFPFPVITGIGHERDDTVVDMAAHTKCKTPTDVAQFIIGGVRAFEERLLDSQGRLIRSAERLLRDERQRLLAALGGFRHLALQALSRAHRLLDAHVRSVTALPRLFVRRRREEVLSRRSDVERGVRQGLVRQEGKIDRLGQALRHLDPLSILRRGYSITTLRGKSLHRSEGVPKGVTIHTRLYQGWLRSRVEESGDE